MSSFLQFSIALLAVLLLASLSGYVSERAGVVNIGIEGMLAIGALITAMIGSAPGLKDASTWNQVWAIIIAAVTAGVFALLHGFASITLKADQTISGTALNILASGIALFFATSGLFGESHTEIATSFSPIYLDHMNIIPMWLIVALVLALGLWVFFKFTKWGMRYKMVGENPNAVDAAGISVIKYRYIAVFLSGVVAGIAGGILVTTLDKGSFDGNTNGYGFLGLAILIFGQWKVGWITLGTIVFSFLFGLGMQLGSLSNVVSVQTAAPIFKVVPFLLTIVMMVIFSKWSKAPAADGVPFDKAMR